MPILVKPPLPIICHKCGRHGHYQFPDGTRSPEFYSKEFALTMIDEMKRLFQVVLDDSIWLQEQIKTRLVVGRINPRNKREVCDTLYPYIGAPDLSQFFINKKLALALAPAEA